MITLFLRQRAVHLPEMMDNADCDPAALSRTYAQFDGINRLVSGWSGVYRRWLRPALNHGAVSVLDLGCGGGDIAHFLARCAARDGSHIQITGADPDSRAIEFARTQNFPNNVQFIHADAASLLADGQRFDLVYSNHVLHHLEIPELRAFCEMSAQLAQVGVLHADIRRSDLAYALFPLAGLLFRRSFIVTDGLRSIRRSFTIGELSKVVPAGWSVTTDGPFRLHARWDARP